MPDSKTYTGGCHCGMVRFECTSDLAMVTACNCSICTKKGLHFAFLPPKSFQLRAGEDNLKEYLSDPQAKVKGNRMPFSGYSNPNDVADVIEQEVEEDIKALGGVTHDEELSDSVWTIARGRFNWLLVNLATAFLASSGVAIPAV